MAKFYLFHRNIHDDKREPACGNPILYFELNIPKATKLKTSDTWLYREMRHLDGTPFSPTEKIGPCPHCGVGFFIHAECIKNEEEFEQWKADGENPWIE
jgi:hypothetical protein